FDLNTQYETEKKERLLAEKELVIEKQHSRHRLIIIVGSLLMLSALGYFVSYRRNQKIKVQKAQREKENAVLNSFINGEERERTRISQELHDGLAALVSAAKMSLETIPHLDETKKEQQIAKTKNILENTHAEIRHIAHNLMPVTLEKEGLIKAAEQFVNDIKETQILDISFVDNTHNKIELPLQIQLMLYRVIQELVNNIIKHSQAKQDVITFSSKEDNTLQIEVSDNGKGFDGNVSKESQGLYSIRQRLQSIGGNFILKRNDSSGMQAIAELKLR